MEPTDRRNDWAHGVDENLASLNAGLRVWEREIAVLRKQWSDTDKLLRGDPGSLTSGFETRLQAIEKSVAKMEAVLFVDSTGKKGLLHDFYELQDGREDRRTAWGNLTKIVVAAIMSGLITHFWSNIAEFVAGKKTDPVEQLLEKAKHPRTKRHVQRIPETPAETD